MDENTTSNGVMEPDNKNNSSSPKQSHFHKYIFPTLVILIVLIISVWIVKKYRNPMQMTVLQSGESMDMTSMGGRIGTVPVETALVMRGTIRQTYTYTGSVLPLNEQIIYPRITGKILRIPVYPGDKVAPGQLLVQLDAEEITSRYQEAQFNFEAAANELKMSDKEIDAAKERKNAAASELEMAQADLAYWEKEIKRQESLFKNGAVSKDEYESELSQYKSALAKVAKAESMVKESDSMIAVSQLKSAKTKSMQKQTLAGQKTAAVIRDYTRILSPFAGTVSERMVSPGNLVEPGTAILKVVDSHQVRIQVNIPTSAMSGIQKGNPIIIYSEKDKNTLITSKISAIFPSADPTSRTVTIEAIVSNQKQLFIPGDFVSVEISAQESEDALLIPSSAVIRSDSEHTTLVWVVEPLAQDSSKSATGKNTSSTYYTCVMHPEVMKDQPGDCPICGMTLVEKQKPNPQLGEGTAHLKKVSVGIKDSQNTEILSGLDENQTVIIRGTNNLQEGDKVRSSNAGSTPATEPATPPETKPPASKDDMSGMKM